MTRFSLNLGVVIVLATASCANTKAVDDAGGNGQSGGSAGQGSGGAGTGGGAGGSSIDSAGLDAASGGGTGSGGDAAGSGGAVVDASVADAASVDGSAGWPAKGRTGMKSAGCGKMPMGAVATSFTNHRIKIPTCAACTVPNCPSDCIAPPFATGGVNFQSAANGETFLDRDYTIELPAGYDPNHPYPMFFGANGCG
ncbi:MAG TPA: hypothetical protein VNO55_32480, partial [Polyangia bacterium]|nr:hypothetical protein [Polyangia bacterium]